MLNIHHLELFYYVARFGGIMEAVRNIPYGIQQPAVSGQILQLESDLGLKLFHRRPFELTPAGCELYDFIRPFFGGVERVGEKIRGGTTQTIRMAAPSAVLRDHLPEVLQRVRQQFPKLRLLLRDAHQPLVEAWLDKHEIDFAVTVVEGRDRIGGRVHTDTSLGVPLELGAGWIHGADGNPLTELAEEFGVERLVTDPDEIVVYDVDGTEADEGTLEAIEDGLHELDFDEAPTVGETIEAALSQLAPDQARLGRYLATAIIEHEEAADIDSLSPETLLAGEEFDGEENVIPDGYIGLLAPLADGIEVQLGRTVTSIRDDTDGVKIGFTDGTNATADAVLVTVPLGVLKAGVIEFDPVLPDDKLAAIERLGMGVLNRVILEYDERFWDDDVEVIGFVGEEPGLFVEWYDWTRVVGKPVIVGFNAGSVAERLESLDDDAIIALATSALDTMYT